VKYTVQFIIDYLENALTADERRSFEASLDKSIELQQELKEIRLVWESSLELKLHRQIDSAKNWKELSKKITVDKYQKKIRRFVRNMAALLMIPLVMATVILYRATQRDHIPAGQIELTSANGLVTKVTLSDGTEVWLNSGSKLSYPQYFTGDIRHVLLLGEAYFKVKADRTKRFEVLTVGGLTVSAYGTEFNVCAYEEDPVVEATLISGNIEAGTSVKNGTPDLINISAGQQVRYDKNNDKLEVADVNLAVKTSWKDGKMIFRRADMTEIMRRLARHYNVDIRLEGKELYDYEYSATFTTETLEEILYLLEKSAPIKCRIIYPEQSEDYTYTRKTVIISMKEI
jgi:ferric-dicitrate binding protein FerR (iron transport regulator)